jgi:hypothetical protein
LVGALLGATLYLLLMFLEPIGFPVDRDDLAPMDEAIDESDDGSGVGKDFSPLGKSFICGHQQRSLEIAAGDDLKEQIGVPGVVGEIAELVKDEQLGLAEWVSLR